MAHAQPCDLTGTVINDLYRVEGVLSSGGMGQVLLCMQLRRNTLVVMKQMLRSADPEDRNFQRFMQEIRITSRLDHPNLIKVLDYGILLDGFKPYLVMEFVKGWSLREILVSEPSLHPGEIAEILMQTCKGLYEVHCKGIIHRDLKPENLMVHGDFQAPDNVKVLDFGVAQLQEGHRVDESGLAVGTVGYMSPEQVFGQTADLRSDIYSLGVMLYEAIIGKKPYKGMSVKNIMHMHAYEQFPPTSQYVQYPNSEIIDQICQIALAKKPEQRYQNVKEFYQALCALLPRDRCEYRWTRTCDPL